MRSFALAAIFAMAASLKVKSKETGTAGTATWQDPAAGGMECANATFETISQKFTWGWLSIADLAMFTEVKCGNDCQDIDWNAIDWDFIHRLRDGWKDAFTNYEWNYVERSVEASKFADYVSRIASELGKGQADLEWLLQNGCKNFNARQARKDALGQEYWDIMSDAQSESWAYCDLDRQEEYDRGFKAGEEAHFNATMGIFNGTNGTNSTGSSWDDSSYGGSSWDNSTSGGSSWDDSSAGGSSWDDTTMPPPPATGAVDCANDPANPMCMTGTMPPIVSPVTGENCESDPANPACMTGTMPHIVSPVTGTDCASDPANPACMTGTMPPPPATGAVDCAADPANTMCMTTTGTHVPPGATATDTVDCLTDPANPICMPSGTATATMPPPPTSAQAADCAADPAYCMPPPPTSAQAADCAADPAYC